MIADVAPTPQWCWGLTLRRKSGEMSQREHRQRDKRVGSPYGRKVELKRPDSMKPDEGGVSLRNRANERISLKAKYSTPKCDNELTEHLLWIATAVARDQTNLKRIDGWMDERRARRRAQQAAAGDGRPIQTRYVRQQQEGTGTGRGSLEAWKSSLPGGLSIRYILLELMESGYI